MKPTDVSAPVRNIAQEERNLAIVLEFYDRVFNRQDINAVKEYLVENYIQHNPTLSDGRAPLINALPKYYLDNPDLKFRFVRSAAQGDLVFLHSHRTTGADDLGRAYVDIFRLEHGKIAEHWDVWMAVPDKSANTNTMF
ncbi:MAG: nuclear transport factor 2 family protein [Hyphomonadaceae bacterium]